MAFQPLSRRTIVPFAIIIVITLFITKNQIERIWRRSNVENSITTIQVDQVVTSGNNNTSLSGWISNINHRVHNLATDGDGKHNDESNFQLPTMLNTNISPVNQSTQKSIINFPESSFSDGTGVLSSVTPDVTRLANSPLRLTIDQLSHMPMQNSSNVDAYNLTTKATATQRPYPDLTDHSMQTVIELNSDVKLGGQWKPNNNNLALVVPYRNRPDQLRIFLNNMHQFLRNQNVNYRVFIVEQTDTTKFNRAMLFNIGFVEANKLGNFSCFVFHDVDLIPEDERHIYSCHQSPRHLSAAVDKFNYKLPYEAIFGGAVSLTKNAFQKVNGFSNLYFGWGGEDDDLYNRIKVHGMNILRYPMEMARFKMIKHSDEIRNPQRFNLLNRGQARMKTDGLSSLVYTLVNITLHPLYTNVTVDINMAKVMASV